MVITPKNCGIGHIAKTWNLVYFEKICTNGLYLKIVTKCATLYDALFLQQNVRHSFFRFKIQGALDFFVSKCAAPHIFLNKMRDALFFLKQNRASQKVIQVRQLLTFWPVWLILFWKNSMFYNGLVRWPQKKTYKFPCFQIEWKKH